MLVQSRTANEVACITGEPGSGKTRLAEALARAAEEAGVCVVWGRPQQYAEELPYLCVQQIIGQLGPSATAGSVPPFDDRTDDWASLSVDARTMRSRYVLRIARSVLDRAQSTPLLLVVDDLQWADAASLLLLSTLADQAGSGLLLLCLTRPEAAKEDETTGLIKAIKAAATNLTLEGLSAEDISALSASVLGPSLLTSDEELTLRDWTQGNPLFVLTLLNHLKRSGLISEHGMQEALHRSDTPGAVSESVDAVVHDLGPEVRRLLAAAAVLGDEFECADLEELTSETEDRVSGLLRSAREAGVVTSDGFLSQNRVKFAHPIYRQRLYELLSPSQLRGLHGRVVAMSESGVLALSPAELATHHSRGVTRGPNDDVVEHCKVAAVHAEKLLAYEAAGRFWEMALEHTAGTDVAVRAELLKRRGWALWAASSWERAEEAWADAQVLYEALGEHEQTAELALAIGDMLRWRQDLDGSERWLKQALQDLPEDSSSRPRALALLGSILSLRGESEPALDMLREAARAIDASGSSDPRIDVWLSYGLRRAGDTAAGKQIAERGLASARDADDTQSTVLLSGTLALMELADLNPEGAATYLALMDQSSGQADPATLVNILQTRAYYLGYSGQWRQVAKLCETAKASLRLVGSYQVASVDVLWAEAQFALGHTREAAAVMTSALPYLEAMQPIARVHRARVLAATGDGQSAVDDVRTFLDMTRNPGIGRAGATVLGDTAASFDEPDLWQPAYDLLARESAQLSFVYSPASVGRVRGRLATRLQRWDDAIDHFEDALHTLSEGGAISELRRSLQDYAAMRRTRGRRGDSTKADALLLRSAALPMEEAWPPATPYAAPRDANEYGLSGREVEVLRLVARGLRNREIAGELSLSPNTVERHLENIYSKMAASGRAEAVTLAAAAGLLSSS